MAKLIASAPSADLSWSCRRKGGRPLVPSVISSFSFLSLLLPLRIFVFSGKANLLFSPLHLFKENLFHHLSLTSPMEILPFQNTFFEDALQ